MDEGKERESIYHWLWRSRMFEFKDSQPSDFGKWTAQNCFYIFTQDLAFAVLFPLLVVSRNFHTVVEKILCMLPILSLQ